MDNLDISNRIDELEREIAMLPPGGIAVKKIGERNTTIIVLIEIKRERKLILTLIESNR